MRDDKNSRLIGENGAKVYKAMASSAPQNRLVIKPVILNIYATILCNRRSVFGPPFQNLLSRLIMCWHIPYTFYHRAVHQDSIALPT